MVSVLGFDRDTRSPMPGVNPSTGLYWSDDRCLARPARQGGSAARTRDDDRPYEPLLHSRRCEQGAVRGYSEAIWPHGRALLRGNCRAPRAHGSGHSALGYSAVQRWGAAYRYGIKRRTPRRSEGSWCQWFRSDLFGDAQSELVLKKPGLAAGSLVYVTREATRGLVLPTCGVEEVTSS